jgi:hypothetical protein
MDPMSDPVHTIVLCEDLQLRCFIRRFLVKRGWHTRQIREVPLPVSGAGVSWVRVKFPDELKAYRSRHFRAETCLIVGIDADHDTIAARIEMLSAACSARSVPFRSNDDRIAFVIPKRNIETWLAYLRGEEVNETDAYPKYDNERDCRDQVARLNKMCLERAWQPDPPPPSLAQACQEFQRI